MANKSPITRPPCALPTTSCFTKLPSYFSTILQAWWSSEFLELAFPPPRMLPPTFLPHSKFCSSFKSEFNYIFLRPAFSHHNFYTCEILDDTPKNSFSNCTKSQSLYYATVNPQEAGWSRHSFLNLPGNIFLHLTEWATFKKSSGKCWCMAFTEPRIMALWRPKKKVSKASRRRGERWFWSWEETFEFLLRRW